VVILNREDWLNVSSTPSQFKAMFIWTGYCVCFDTQHDPLNLGINENKCFQSWHTSRHNTRAGFDSAPLVSVEKGCSSIIRYGPSLNGVDAVQTTHPGLLLT
jgi:hypothetical protein